MKGAINSMENKLKNNPSSHKSKKLLVAFLALALIIGTASAAVFSMLYTNTTATVKTPDIQLFAGSDIGGTGFPSATATVASTKDFASIAFSIFPSATNTPQPATYYTDLLQIKNKGATNHIINEITISGLTGVENLGSIEIYLYAAQTDTPRSGSPIGTVTLTSASTGTYTLSTNQAIAADATLYIEVVGYASETASAGSTVGFNTDISWV
jgi:hypothetical protein